MMNTEKKMNWFSKNYNNGTLTYLSNLCGEKYARYHSGTIMIPTGGGKSGIIYSDIVERIKNNKGEKFIFNIASPILKLEAQLMNDFFSIIPDILKNELYSGKFMFFINSSETSNNYDDILTELGGMDVFRFSEIDKFFNSKTAQFAFVATCHKSLEKFVAKLDYMKSQLGVTIINYIDEAHLINTLRGSHAKKDETGKEILKISDIKKLCNDSTHTYAFTATPDQNVTECINETNGLKGKKDMFLCQINPIDLINKNVIIAPKFIMCSSVELTEEDEECRLNPDLAMKFMRYVKEKNNMIYHKILISCPNTKELRKLQNGLAKYNVQIFSTCSADKAKSISIEEGNNKVVREIDEIKFINEVDSYEGDCFVLHIKQLIQGIDIKTITDTIICTAANGDNSEYKKFVQIIGRGLRPLAGERGLAIELRKKQYSNVLFVMPETFGGKQNIERFLHRYYGMDKMSFVNWKNHNESGSNNKDIISDDDGMDTLSYDGECTDYVIRDMLFNMEKYINEELLPKKKFVENHGGKIDIVKEIARLVDSYGKIDIDKDSVELLINVGLENAVKELFVKYEVV